MKPVLFFVVLAAASLAARPVAVQRQDIVGTWTDMSCSPYDGSYEFYEDGVFRWHCEDQIDGGKWQFRPPTTIELISYGDWSKPAITKDSARHSIQIESYTRHKMLIRLIPGGARNVLRR